MSLNVILGRSNTGKSEYIMNKIMACENEKKQAILFVPPSGRILAEEEYLKYTNKKAIIDTLITSVERFVSRRVDKTKLYQDKTYLKDLAKKMMIKKVITENPDMFKVFAKVKDTVGFTDKIADYTEKFEDLQDLTALDKYKEEDFLKTKLDEFRVVYNKIKGALQDKFVASTDEMKSYIDTLKSSEINIINADVFIDNYNNFSNLEYQFIEALLLNGNDVYITLDIDKEKYLQGETEIYNTSYNTLESLKKLCASSGIKFEEINLTNVKTNRPEDIAYLAENIFDTTRKVFNKNVENVKLILEPNTYEEIKYVAGDILKKVNNGMQYKDIAIYTNNISQYNVFLKKILETYNIPTYINEEDNLCSNRLVVFLMALLQLVNNGFTKSIDNVLDLIKTGMLNLTEQEIYMFENYTLEFGVRGYNLIKTFELNSDYDLDKINEIRENIVQTVLTLKQNLAKKKTSNEITEQLYNYLLQNEIISKYENELKIVKEIDINEYNKAKQILAKIYEVMDNISLAYDEITLKEYVALFEYGIKELKVDTIPAKTDQVEVIDINKNRGTEKKIGYIIGCYDGGMPTVQNEDNIFTDIELQKLKSVGIDLKQTSDERNNMQLFNIYQTINKIREELIITVPSSLSLGSSLRPSSLIQDIKTLLNISLVTDNDCETLNIGEDFTTFINSLKDIDEDTSEDEIEQMYTRYLLYKDMPKYNEIMNYARQDKNLEQKTLDEIYAKKINSSVSRLEQFKRCPFAYYTKYVLNLKERKDYVMSSLDTGSFMHEVVEKFSKYIVAKDISWQDLILNDKVEKLAIDKINEIVDKLFEENYSKYLTSARYVVLKAKMKKTMQRTIFAIAESFNHSEFRPLGYEIEFEKDALFAPIEVTLDDGKTLLLRGKIDRIDSLKIEDNTYLRIVDYKSSDKNLKLSDVKDGISLQLMTYMCAMIENKEKLATKNVIPAALSYFTMSNKILSIPNYEKDENKIAEKVRKALKLRGIYIRDIKILKKLDNKVENSKESYLEVSSRTINNDEKVLTEEVFIQECKNVRKILKDIAKEIVKGTVKIEPNKNIKGVCEYCSYVSVCRKNILN